MSKLTATASICQAAEFFGLSIRTGHDQHGYGKVIFADFGRMPLWNPPEEEEICWTCDPKSPLGSSIVAAIRPAKNGVEKAKPSQERRLVRQGTRLLKAVARIEGLLDDDHRNLSFC